MRTYGKIWKENGEWCLQAEPHVVMWAKRVFGRIPRGAGGVLRLTDTPSTCRDLEWFSERFPLEIPDEALLRERAQQHRETILRMEQIVDPGYQPRQMELAIPAREYQLRAAELLLARKSLLLADEVGLGKTVSAIAALTEKETLPAVVVCLANLPDQWKSEVNRFAPELFAHVIAKKTPYELPQEFGRGPDVLIISYHKLSGWADVLARYCKLVVFDEVQEMRRSVSDKYQAGKHVADSMQYRMGLSATPIMNYGSEIFNVIEVLEPDILGRREEFVREWCLGHFGKERLRNPAAFGSWLREQHLMLRRTRRDVARELPDLTRITQHVDCDPKRLKEVEDRAGELARIILSETAGEKGEKMRAAEELNNAVRQATGLAKAPYVAAFVKMLLESGEPVVLFGWHRAVYSVWMKQLEEYSPAMYTGSETVAQKTASKERFVRGDTDLLIMSLRSGSGVDGLQNRGRTVVFGELDWSPGIHHQCAGRIHRDGQADPVAAYFLVTDEGTDPIIADVLGIKTEQIEGIVDPHGREELERFDAGGVQVKRLAELYLNKAR